MGVMGAIFVSVFLMRNVLSPSFQEFFFYNHSFYEKDFPFVRELGREENRVASGENILATVRDSVCELFFLTKKGSDFYDIKSDSSYQKYVNRYVGFENAGYIPPDLVVLQSEYIITTKPFMRLRKEAAEALYAMAKDFYRAMKAKIVIQSAYRSPYQQRLLRAGDRTKSYVAPPGHSEHQGGFAVDVFHVGTKESFFRNERYKRYYEWLVNNAHKYGFHNTYQKGISVDTYLEEPRHWRYLGTKLAAELHEKEVSFGEWVAQKAKEKCFLPTKIPRESR